MAIVVVLILIATVFVVRFVVLKVPTDYRKGFVSSELASNLLNTFLRTNAEGCKQITMTELLQDCAQSESICCFNCGDEDASTHVNSCKFVNSTAKDIFGSTLKKWSMNYEFLVYKGNDKPFIALGSRCPAEKRSKLYPIPIQAATMYVQLDICT